MIYILSVALLLCGCSSSQNDAHFQKKHDSLEYAQNLMNHYEYTSAIKVLEQFQSEQPLSLDMPHVEKLLIECYAQNDDYPMLNAAADRFLYEHMEDPNRDYIAFLRFNAIAKQAYGHPYEWLPIERSARDIAKFKDAFISGKNFIRTYPSSDYAPNVAHALPDLKDAIARHYFLKGRMLESKREYIGSINAYQHVISDFGDTEYAPYASEILDKISKSYFLVTTIIPGNSAE
jgi:outer membrane assembly lipoprotein YfiO